MLELNKIYNQDCLEGMKLIDDKSINLIIADPPYNIGKDSRWDKWKKQSDYIDFMGEIFTQCQRVLKDNGSFYFFHNDFLQIVDLQNWLNNNSRFVFNSFITWDKGDFRALSWKNPSENNNLRSWFNTCEYSLYYTFQDNTGLEYIDREYIAPRNPFKKELIKAREEKGLTITQVAELGKFYKNINHGGAVTNWEKGYNVPLKVQWNLLKTFLPLRREYEDLRYVHNLDINHNNVWKNTTRNNGKIHPTQKPIEIIERMIKTSSNENMIILDPFMGSATTAIACINTNRNYIGFELDKTYFDLANLRIEKNKENLGK